MPKPKRVAIYARVSTADQTCENQLQALRGAAERHGWAVAEEYVDHGISGARGRDKRPALDKLWTAISRREVDLVACWSLDRLGRSTQHLVELAGHLTDKKVGLYVETQGIHTSTAAGRLFFTVLAAIGEFERELTRERVAAGLARARAQGKQLGRPRLKPAVVKKIRALAVQKLSHREIAKRAGVGTGTVSRTLAAS